MRRIIAFACAFALVAAGIAQRMDASLGGPAVRSMSGNALFDRALGLYVYRGGD